MALTADEQAELAALEKEVGGLTPDEAAELAQLEKEVGGSQNASYRALLIQQGARPEDADAHIANLKASDPQSLINEESRASQILEGQKKSSSIGRAGMDAVGRVLDYPGGIARTAAFAGGGSAVGKNPVLAEDWMDALKGKAPGSAEYMKRMGVPEGDKPFWDSSGTFSDRNVGGFIADTALDPTTYATLGIKPLLKALGNSGKAAKALRMADTALNVSNKASESAGKQLYKWGLKRLDRKAAQYGKEPVSEILMKNNIAGGAGKIQKEMDRLVDDVYMPKQTDILKRATQKGAQVSMDDAMGPLRRRIGEIRQSKVPELQPVADAYEAKIGEYLSLSPKQPEQVVSTLPRGITMGGGQTPVSFVPGNSVVSGSPTKTVSEIVGGHTPFSVQPGRADVLGSPTKTVVEMVGGHTPIDMMPPRSNIAVPSVTLDDAMGSLGGRAPKDAPVMIAGPSARERFIGAEVPGVAIERQVPQTMRVTPRSADMVIPGAEVPGVMVRREVPAAMEIGPKTSGRWVPGAEVPDIPLPQKPLAILTETDPTKDAMGRLLDNSGVSPIQANKMKSSAWASIGPQEWRTDKVRRSVTDSMAKAQGSGLKTAIEDSVERALGKGDRAALEETNDALGRLLSTKEQAAMDAAREANKNVITEVKGAMAVAHPLETAAMYAAKAANSAGVRTRVGRGLRDFGQLGIVDPVTRRTMIELSPEEDAIGNYLSPWMGVPLK